MKKIYSIFIAFLSCISLHAQVDTKGTDFWLTFGRNSSTAFGTVTFQIRIVGGDQAATGTIYFTNLGNSVPFSIDAGEVFTHDLNSNQFAAVCNITAGTNNFSAHITSTAPITAYALNQQNATTDATNILPVTALGTDYYQISYAPLSGRVDAYAVIATENATQVYHNGSLVTTLNTGQVYYRTASSDLTSAHVTTTNPAAFFALNQGTNIPVGSSAADIMFQQLAPVNTWGKNFFVPVSHRGRDIVRIMASQNATVVTQTGGKSTASPFPDAPATYTLNAGQFAEFMVPLSGNGCYIQANHPVGVCSYLSGGSYTSDLNGNTNSDPAQAWLPSMEQTVKSALIAPFIPSGSTNLNAHYALIMTSTATKNNTMVSIGGATATALSGGIWRDNAAADMSFYSMPLTNSTASYLFSNQEGLIIMGYGTGSAESYYYLASSAMRTLDAAFYVNDIHYQDLTSEIICQQAGSLQFRAEISGDVSSASGFLKWYIDEVEEIGARDELNWSKSLAAGSYQIKMVVLMDDDITTKIVEGTLVVSSCILAVDDFAITPVNQVATVPVLDNDQLGSCNSSTINLTITTVPHSGVASINTGQIVYMPNAGFVGLDSLNYSIDCSGYVASAWAYIYTYPNITRLCVGSSTNINPGFSSCGASVAWFNGATEVTSIPVSNISSGITYPYEARVTFPVYLGSVLITNTSAGYHINVVPSLMYWNKAASNNNWNDPANWTNASNSVLNEVPLSCTDVHIPGNETVSRYPSLDAVNTLRNGFYDEPECNNIYFHFGGEVAKPHLLIYSKAFVEYNFGYYNGSSYHTDADLHSETPMKRGQWYALAAPLNKIAPGDFSFGGKPDAWQQAFIRNNTSGGFTGQWKEPHNANATDIPATQYGGIAIWMANVVPGSIGEDASYHTNLNALQGVIRMPYFEDSYLSGQHRIHQYIGGESRFYYYNNLDPAQTITTQYSAITRDSDAYRFVFDGNLQSTTINSVAYPTYRLTVPAGQELMVGNPFLSNLDFDMFWEINQHNLENKTYRLYVDNNWGHQYTVGSGGTGSPALTRYIAPLQAFFIQTKGSGTIDLLFPPDLVSVTDAANKLRAAGMEDVYDNVLYVEIANSAGSSWATLGMKEGVNVDQLFNDNELYAHVPQVYFSDRGSKNGVQFISGAAEVSIGVRSQDTGKNILRFRNADRFDIESLVLYDKVTGVAYSLLHGVDEILFDNIPDFPDRFLLQVGAVTLRTTLQNAGVLVRLEGKKLIVEAGEVIRQVTVANMQGISLFNNPSVNDRSFSTDMNVPSGIYIVNITLENGESRVGKVIVM